MTWPDWRGHACAIIASGPSTKEADVGQLRDRVSVRVIAIKENYDLCPWADVVYGCDRPWWRSRRFLPEFNGLKISYGAKAEGIINVEIEEGFHDFKFDEIGKIGSGGNSGFQAVNLAAQFGADRIMLIGFDMHDRSGTHWYGRTFAQGRTNPDESNFKRWRVAFDKGAETLKLRGVAVINCSLHSALTCFPKATLKTALAAWRL